MARPCLGGAIGRDLMQVRIASALGFVTQRVALGVLPGPNGALAVQPGETWHCQHWFRDLNPTLTSNSTDSLSSVTFRWMRVADDRAPNAARRRRSERIVGPGAGPSCSCRCSPR